LIGLRDSSISGANEGRPRRALRRTSPNHLRYGIENFGSRVAARTFARLDVFLHELLPAYPRIGRRITGAGLYEVWVARTPFVVAYRIDDAAEMITVLARFHHAQDRSKFEPDD
jgi:plasmid stabilization system protein ParE